MNISLNHADIIIPRGQEDLARSFYCKLLGLREIEKPEILKNNGGLWIQLSNSQLHLSYEKKEGIDPRKTKAHLAFEVDDLEKLEKKLTEQGFPIKKQEPLPNMIRLETEDPFGHRIEFLQALSIIKL